jgi:SAM-dependent methyltransferase
MINESIQYYQRQRGQRKYLDSLLELGAPSMSDVVLIIERGSATASFLLGDRVKKIHAVEPNGDPAFIRANRTLVEELVKEREFLPHFHVDFTEFPAEEIGQSFLPAYFDTIVFWGSLHHCHHAEKALEGARDVCRPGGKLIIFDGFFPEPIREFWTLASTIHDPSTVRHRTYSEYMILMRQFGFIPKTILPFEHPQNLDEWLNAIRKSDEDIIQEIKSIHPGKYDAWLDRAREKGLRQTLRDEILQLDDEQKALLSIRCQGKDAQGNDQYGFINDTFLLLAEKAE